MADPRRPNVQNAADKGQTEAARRTMRFEDKKYLYALKEVLRTQPGRLVITEILRTTDVMKYHGMGTVEELNFNEGKRQIGIRLWNDVALIGGEALTKVFADLMVPSNDEHVKPPKERAE